MVTTLVDHGRTTESFVLAMDELVEFLSDPESYCDGTSTVEIRETHISWVALTDRRVYKVKKPLRFPFLDYSTSALRLAACRDEVRLGSRLAPGVYLGYQPITRGPNGNLQFGGDGPSLDYCVLMKRLPAHRMFDSLIRNGTAGPQHIESLLSVLVPFYRRAARGPEIDRYATAQAIERQVRENLATLDSIAQRLAAPTLQRVRASQLQFLRLSANTFTDRIHAGRICEGHGDLRAEHVCFTDPPVVFDCVEFSLPFRAADVASELAFLAMECDYLGAPELGESLIQGYRTQSAEDLPESLINFYKSYRACVRAKVEQLRAEQLTGTAADESHRRAARYLQLASFYATQFYRPKLLVMVGTAGSGKSTLAESIADDLGMVVLRSDAIRHELAGTRQPGAAYASGIYSEDMTERTYEAMFERARKLLGDAVSVVLDATFRDERHRQRAADLAHQYGADVQFVRCACPTDVARDRIAKRIARRQGISDARPELVATQDQEIQSGSDWSRRPLLVVDSTQPVELGKAAVLKVLQHRQDHS